MMLDRLARPLVPAAALLAVTTAPALAAPAAPLGDDETSGDRAARTSSVEVRLARTADEDADGKRRVRTVVVTENDDGRTVTVNGQTVPAERIRVEGDRLVVLDEHGEPMKEVSIDFDFAPIQVELMRARDFDFNLESLGDLSDEGFVYDLVMPGGDVKPLPVMLGVSMQPPGAALCHHLDLDPQRTTMLTNVVEGLPAHRAGLRQHDLIVAIEGADDASPKGIRSVLAGKAEGETVVLEVVQAGRDGRVTVTLDAYDASKLGTNRFFGGEWTTRGFEFEPGQTFLVPSDPSKKGAFGRRFSFPGLDGEVEVFIEGDARVDDEVRQRIEESMEKLRSNVDLEQIEIRRREAEDRARSGIRGRIGERDDQASIEERIRRIEALLAEIRKSLDDRR